MDLPLEDLPPAGSTLAVDENQWRITLRALGMRIGVGNFCQFCRRGGFVVTLISLTQQFFALFQLSRALAAVAAAAAM